jgi:prevent-host-death family protein
VTERGFVMAEEIVPVTKFKAACLALLEKVKKTGQPILVTRRGEPIALISPPPRPEKPKTWLGSFKSKGRIVGDIVSPIADERDWEALRE